MPRSNVVDHIFLMPMKVSAQREGDKTLLLMPAWQLPHGLLVEGVDMDDALEKLEEKMYQYWGKA